MFVRRTTPVLRSSIAEMQKVMQAGQGTTRVHQKTGMDKPLFYATTGLFAVGTGLFLKHLVVDIILH